MHTMTPEMLYEFLPAAGYFKGVGFVRFADPLAGRGASLDTCAKT